MSETNNFCFFLFFLFRIELNSECHFKLKYADETGTISAIGSIQYQNLKYSINSWNHDNTFESGISLELIGGIAAGFVDDRGFFI